MNKYISTTEVAEKWGISGRRVSLLCAEERIPGVVKVGKTWLVPADTPKPVDARIKSGKYIGTRQGNGRQR